MTEPSKVIAENGMVIGISGMDRLCCPACGELLEWVESKDGFVKLDENGVLIPVEEEEKSVWRATPKEAYCCGMIYKADPWASFRITSESEE